MLWQTPERVLLVFVSFTVIAFDCKVTKLFPFRQISRKEKGLEVENF
jgi:hypothetical protein